MQPLTPMSVPNEFPVLRSPLTNPGSRATQTVIGGLPLKTQRSLFRLGQCTLTGSHYLCPLVVDESASVPQTSPPNPRIHVIFSVLTPASIYSGTFSYSVFSFTGRLLISSVTFHSLTPLVFCSSALPTSRGLLATSPSSPLSNRRYP